MTWACDPRSAMSCLKSQACALWSSSSAFRLRMSSFINNVAPAQQSGCQIVLAFQVSAKKWGHNVAHTVVWARVCGPGIASSPLSSCTKDREIRTDFEIARSRSRETSALFSSVELLRIQRLSCRVCVQSRVGYPMQSHHQSACSTYLDEFSRQPS